MSIKLEFKRVLAIFLSLVMILGLMPISPVYADTVLDYVDMGTGYYVSDILSGGTGVIDIPLEYSGKPVIGIADNAFANNKSITGVNFNGNPNLEYIGYRAFAFTGLQGIVDIPATNGTLNIGEQAFAGGDFDGSTITGKGLITGVNFNNNVNQINFGPNSFRNNSITGEFVSKSNYNYISTGGGIYGAFRENNITRLVVEGSMTVIWDMFRDNPYTEVVLPEGVETIKDGSFAGAVVTTFVLPSTVKVIEGNNFSGFEIPTLPPYISYKYSGTTLSGQGSKIVLPIALTDLNMSSFNMVRRVEFTNTTTNITNDANLLALYQANGIGTYTKTDRGWIFGDLDPVSIDLTSTLPLSYTNLGMLNDYEIHVDVTYNDAVTKKYRPHLAETIDLWVDKAKVTDISVRFERTKDLDGAVAPSGYDKYEFVELKDKSTNTVLSRIYEDFGTSTTAKTDYQFSITDTTKDYILNVSVKTPVKLTVAVEENGIDRTVDFKGVNGNDILGTAKYYFTLTDSIDPASTFDNRLNGVDYYYMNGAVKTNNNRGVRDLFLNEVKALTGQNISILSSRYMGLSKDAYYGKWVVEADVFGEGIKKYLVDFKLNGVSLNTNVFNQIALGVSVTGYNNLLKINVGDLATDSVLTVSYTDYVAPDPANGAQLVYRLAGYDDALMPIETTKYLYTDSIPIKNISEELKAILQVSGKYLRYWISDNTGSWLYPNQNYTGEFVLTNISSLLVNMDGVLGDIADLPIQYNGNGNTGGVAPIETKTGIFDYVAIKDKGTLTKDGYVFKNWNSAANGSGTVYAPGVFGAGVVWDSGEWKYEINTLTTRHGNPVMLYAQWTPLIQFDGNGNTSGNAPGSITQHNSTAWVTVPNQNDLVKEGFNFLGWSKNPTDTSAFFLAGNQYWASNLYGTLYAIWEAQLPAQIIQFNGNGNTGGTAPSDINESNPTAMVTVPNQNDLVKEGFNFLGWSKNPLDTVATFIAGNQYQASALYGTLYAVWGATLPPQQFQIVYKPMTTDNMLDWGNGISDYSQTELNPTNVQIIQPWGRTGYTLLGFDTDYDDGNYDGIVDIMVNDFKYLNIDIELRAIWLEQPTDVHYNIQFQNADGTMAMAPNNFWMLLNPIHFMSLRDSYTAVDFDLAGGTQKIYTIKNDPNLPANVQTLLSNEGWVLEGVHKMIMPPPIPPSPMTELIGTPTITLSKGQNLNLNFVYKRGIVPPPTTYTVKFDKGVYPDSITLPASFSGTMDELKAGVLGLPTGYQVETGGNKYTFTGYQSINHGLLAGTEPLFTIKGNETLVAQWTVEVIPPLDPTKSYLIYRVIGGPTPGEIVANRVEYTFTDAFFIDDVDFDNIGNTPGTTPSIVNIPGYSLRYWLNRGIELGNTGVNQIQIDKGTNEELVAEYTPLPNYTITYAKGLTTSNPVLPNSVTTYEGNTVIVGNVDLAHVSKLVHWMDQDGNVYSSGDSITLTKSLNLTAIWNYSISFDKGLNPNAVTLPSNFSGLQNEVKANALAIPTYDAIVNNKKYTFTGWLSVLKGLIDKTITDYVVAGDDTLTAQWQVEDLTPPTTEAPTQPAPQPTEPVAPQPTEPTPLPTEPVTEPITEPVTQPTTEKPTEATEPTTEPKTEPTTEPTTENSTEPVTELKTESTTEQNVVIVDKIEKPVVEQKVEVKRGNINGQVLGRDGKPLKGVKFELNPGLIVDYSDVNGYYKFVNLELKKYEISMKNPITDELLGTIKVQVKSEGRESEFSLSEAVITESVELDEDNLEGIVDIQLLVEATWLVDTNGEIGLEEPTEESSEPTTEKSEPKEVKKSVITTKTIILFSIIFFILLLLLVLALVITAKKSKKKKTKVEEVVEDTEVKDLEQLL